VDFRYVFSYPPIDYLDKHRAMNHNDIIVVSNDEKYINR